MARVHVRQGVVVVAFIALAVVSGFGAAQIKQEFRREWFLPGDSYLQEFYAVQRDHFSDVGVPVSVYVPSCVGDVWLTWPCTRPGADGTRSSLVWAQVRY